MATIIYAVSEWRHSPVIPHKNSPVSRWRTSTCVCVCFRSANQTERCTESALWLAAAPETVFQLEQQSFLERTKQIQRDFTLFRRSNQQTCHGSKYPGHLCASVYRKTWEACDSIVSCRLRFSLCTRSVRLQHAPAVRILPKDTDDNKISLETPHSPL